MTSARPTVVQPTAFVLAAVLGFFSASPAAAWRAETFEPLRPQTHVKSLSVTVGQKAWVLTVRTPRPQEDLYYVWYLDVGEDGSGQHRGAEYLLASAPGEVLLFTLPTGDQSAVGSLVCTLDAEPLERARPGQKVRVPQSCLAAPERLRVRLSASLGEDSVSWSPGFGRDRFHAFVDNVARPVT